MYGSYGKLLRINLTDKMVKEETIPDEVFQQYLGGKGLGAYLLLNYLPAKIYPLSPDNKLIFATGPATDTTIPAAGRYGVYTKSPLTGYFGESYSGGHTAPAMKRTGYDAIMIEGAADKPVYIHVSDKGVEFGDAADLWGQETYTVEDALLEKVNVGGAQAVVIGTAGENLVRYACLKNNHWRSAGRTGMGAVMGSKKLKGIVFSGAQKAPLADEQALQNYVKELVKKYKDSERTRLLRKYGTPVVVALANNYHTFPTRYWSESYFENWERVSADALLERLDVKPRACSRCFIACGNLSTVKEGRHRGLTVEGPEYETIYAIGGLCCIGDIEEVVYLNDLCDRLGMDTISAGNTVAFAIEAGKRGKLSGMPDYGDVDGIATLFEQIAKKEGVGELLSKGVKAVSEELGLEDLAVHVKGLEPAGYDPRVLTGMSLAYSVSDRGACHLRSSFYMAELGGADYAASVPKEQVEGKTKLYLSYENRNTLEDCLILCRFYMKFIGWEGIGPIVKATTGMDLSQKELAALASQVTTLARRFNLREGMNKEEDYLPPRMFNDPVGPEKNLVARREDLDLMLREYYQLHGWDENGVPKD